ncbi:hypothetical protein MLD38_027348 [Melastoma candidum]|uniref:Uncharacterized protein n=1 Tax=Melastoma candidum TaxID=119954 RepID=A0ACB9P1B1_9MYRT|nr:hypothetical protein MLD38_027348 [Melastoma candidum]
MREWYMIGGGVVGFIILLLLVLIACKPWRYFRPPARSNLVPSVVEDLERPLVSDDAEPRTDKVRASARGCDLEGALLPKDGNPRPHRLAGLIHKQRLPFSSPRFNQGVSVVVDVPNPTEDVRVEVGVDLEQPKNVVIKESGDQRSCLTLEVLSGPSQGTRCSVQSTDTPRLPLTLGRVLPSDLLVKDSEVSGKHAMIQWNLNKLKWELVDMGSLNGTLLNSQPIYHANAGSRHWGDPMELSSGDIITLGTTSTVSVHIKSQSEFIVPFGVGLASDPMALRRGGKKLPMEDVCYYRWPLPGHDQFGLFGICDGHGGAEAAKFASKCIPVTLATVLSESFNKEKLLSQKDASHVLCETFFRTEECMTHYYEGCTATVLLIWCSGNGNLFAQCANVGDSACVLNVDGKLVRMTEDHRVTSSSERHRIRETGEPLRDGETRLCGLNLARMLGDKFLKQQDIRFSSKPYISEVVQIDRVGRDFAIIASDGFWDVIGMKKSVQLALQMMERHSGMQNLAEKTANSLLNEARNLRTKDNTSIIFLDFSGDHSEISSFKDNSL